MLSALSVVFFALPLRASTSDQLQFANGLFSRGLYELALAEYENLLEGSADFPNQDAVLFRRAECYREMGNKRAAEAAYRRVLTEKPESPYRFRAEFRRAELFVAGRQYEVAESLFAMLIARNPPAEVMASSIYFLGYAQDRQEKFQEAESSYRKVVVDHKDSPYSAYAALALAQIFLNAEGREAEADALLKDLEENSPTDRVAAEAVFLRADAAYRSEKFSKSAALYRVLMDRFPKDRRARESRLQAAWSLYNDGAHDEALELARRVLAESEPADAADWLYLKANAERKAGDASASIATYDTLLSAYPSNSVSAAAMYEQLLMYYTAENYEQVIGRGSGIQVSADLREDYLWLLAESFSQLGRDTEALTQFKALTKEFPDSERAASALFRQARILQAAQNTADAARHYEETAEKHPTSELAAEALYTAGYCWMAERRFEEAIKNWSQLRNSHPTFERIDDAQYQKGLAEIKLEREEEAVTTFLELVRDAPDCAHAANALYWVAVLAEKSGDLAEAEQRLREALLKKPDVSLEGQIQYRLAAVLQKREKFEEAADLLQSLLDGPVAGEMPDELLEWLARYRIERQEGPSAVAAAGVLSSRSVSPAWTQIAEYLKGEAFLLGGDADSAQAAFAASIEAEADTQEEVLAASRLAGIAFEKGNLPEAEKYYSLAAELASDPQLLNIQATSYFGLGRVAEARQDWAEAARRFLSVGILFDDPAVTPEALFYAVRAFEKAGKGRERKKVAEELLERYPDSEWADKIKGRD
jgi:TolA-binding protein